MMKVLIWLEFLLIVIPLTLLMGLLTVLFPFGALARPGWIIPSYLGGLMGAYFLWEAFGILVFGHKRNLDILYLCFSFSVIALVWFLSKGQLNSAGFHSIFTSVLGLPVFVGGHWAILLYVKR